MTDAAPATTLDAPAPAAVAPWPTIGRYRVVRRLGGGGMGEVFLAHDPNLNDRLVAIKVPRFDGPPEYGELLRKRFLQEAAAAAGVPHHPHVCPVYDFGEHDGRPFLVMAHLPGGSLAERLKRDKRIEDVHEAVVLAKQAAEGLAALHAAGVVHRDLKPGNILLDQDGRPLLTDFGLAHLAGGEHLTRPGALLGTPAYMAPEQADKGAAAAKEPADVYALGVVLYHMLTGRTPFEGDLMQIVRQLGIVEPPSATSLRAGLDPTLEGVLQRAMARRPEDRPTAAAFAKLLTEWLEGSTVRDLGAATAAKPVSPQRGGAWHQRAQRWRWRAAAVGGALLLAIAAWRLSGPAAALRDSRDRPAYTGSINVRVWDEKNRERRRLRLNEPGALPLRAGDRVRVEAEMHPAAYLYVVAIGPAGEVQPLYPWTPGQWHTRPADERPRDQLNLPETAADDSWEVNPGSAGMETVLLLARPTPLTHAEEDQLHALLTGFGPQPAQTSRTAVWFENGNTVTQGEAERSLNFNGGKLDDPVLRTQALLKDKLRPLFPYTRAVSYANQGK